MSILHSRSIVLCPNDMLHPSTSISKNEYVTTKHDCVTFWFYIHCSALMCYLDNKICQSITSLFSYRIKLFFSTALRKIFISPKTPHCFCLKKTLFVRPTSHSENTICQPSTPLFCLQKTTFNCTIIRLQILFFP